MCAGRGPLLLRGLRGAEFILGLFPRSIQVLVVSSSRNCLQDQAQSLRTWALLPHVDVTWPWQSLTTRGAFDMRVF